MWRKPIYATVLATGLAFGGGMASGYTFDDETADDAYGSVGSYPEWHLLERDPNEIGTWQQGFLRDDVVVYFHEDFSVSSTLWTYTSGAAEMVGGQHQGITVNFGGRANVYAEYYAPPNSHNVTSNWVTMINGTLNIFGTDLYISDDTEGWSGGIERDIWEGHPNDQGAYFLTTVRYADTWPGDVVFGDGGPGNINLISSGGGAAGFTPEAGYTLIDNQDGTWTIVKSGGGFDLRPSFAPVPVHFDLVDHWYDKGVLKDPYDQVADGTYINTVAGVPYGSALEVLVHSDNTYGTERTRVYKSSDDFAGTGGSAANFRLNNPQSWYNDYDLSGHGVVYVRWWWWFNDAYEDLWFAAPEKYLRIWDGWAGTRQNAFMSWQIHQLLGGGGAINTYTSTANRFPSWDPNNPEPYVVNGWNLVEFYVSGNGTPEETILQGWINSTEVVSSHGVEYWTDWPLVDGLAPRALLWDGNTGTNRSSEVEGKVSYASDIYADSTPQRVEIADADTGLYDSTVREVCMVFDWQDDEITFVINVGGHASLSGTTLYWVDDENNATKVGVFD